MFALKKINNTKIQCKISIQDNWYNYIINAKEKAASTIDYIATIAYKQYISKNLN